MKSVTKAMMAMLMLVIIIVGCKKQSDPIVDSEGNGDNNSDVIVTTYTPQSITGLTAVCGGEVIVTQELSLTEIGVCWSKNSNPTADSMHYSTSDWNEPLWYTIQNLTPETTYHVRAYALCDNEYFYGEEKTFTTDSVQIYYNDADTINIVLREEYHVDVTSECALAFASSDDLILSILDNGCIYGKNIGQARLTIYNSYKSMTVVVNVNLFREPTFEFGCSPNYISELYGEPFQSGYNNEGMLVYRYTSNQGYSYACSEMDVFFEYGCYIESDLYIRPSCEILLDNYLNENFDHIYDYYDTIVNPNSSQNTIVTVSIYKNKFDEDVYCGKRLAMNSWNEILLYYFKDDIYDHQRFRNRFSLR